MFKPKIKFDLLKLLKSFWNWSRNSLAVFGLVCIIYMVAITAVISNISGSDTDMPEVKAGAIVSLTINGSYPEDNSQVSFSDDFFSDNPSFFDLMSSLRDVAEDERVSELVVNLKETDLSYAQIQELREIIKKISAKGKKTLVFSDDLGPSSNAMRKYYLATAFNEIYIQPMATVAITGIGTEMPFAKALLDKAGVEADFVRTGKYKSYPEMFTRTEISKENEEMTKSLVGDISSQVMKDIAEDRRIPLKSFTSMVDMGIFTDTDAKKFKLIDGFAHWDNIVEAKNPIKLEDYEDELQGGDLGFVSSMFAGFGRHEENISMPRVALVVAEGEISDSGKNHIDAEELTKTFNDIIKDGGYSAIVLRLNTPGGSAVLSETIRNSLERAKASGLKVIVSMSGVTASGGYWIASSADKIVAEPATITGSIGVFGGKFVLKGLWDKVGVNWGRIGFGNNVGMWSSNSKFSPDERARMEKVIDRTYEGFIERVSKGRNMNADKVRKIAEGRVWSGKQAKEIGLVDELGGMFRAVNVAKREIGLTKDDKVMVEQYPLEKSKLEKLFDMLENKSAILSKILDSDFVAMILSFNAQMQGQAQLY